MGRFLFGAYSLKTTTLKLHKKIEARFPRRPLIPIIHIDKMNYYTMKNIL